MSKCLQNEWCKDVIARSPGQARGHAHRVIQKSSLRHWIPAGVYPCENRDGNDRKGRAGMTVKGTVKNK